MVGSQKSERRAIRTAKDLEVYKSAWSLSMDIFELCRAKRFRREERYALKSDPPLIQVRLHESARSLGKAADTKRTLFPRSRIATAKPAKPTHRWISPTNAPTSLKSSTRH